ncbi:MAG: hypothetical protein Q4B26_09850 [Eubacteriales bacterium]|nr:hypothetical protein [Eubacteriales bacterium]
MQFEIKRLKSLFDNQNEYQEFCERHENASVKKGELLFSYYTGNKGKPIEAVINGIRELKGQISFDIKRVRNVWRNIVIN